MFGLLKVSPISTNTIRSSVFNSPPLILGDIYVDRVHEHKHLGIYLSSSLSWARQCHEVTLRANRKLAVLGSIKYLKRSTLDLLYKVCVRSVIEYGLVLYLYLYLYLNQLRLQVSTRYNIGPVSYVVVLFILLIKVALKQIYLGRQLPIGQNY